MDIMIFMNRNMVISGVPSLVNSNMNVPQIAIYHIMTISRLR